MVYTILGSENYEIISCLADDGYDVFNTFQGTSLAESWHPVQVERVPADVGHPALPSDFPWLTSGELIMRRRAVLALRDLLEAGGEILPLSTGDGVALFALNVTRVLDAMDEENSSIERFSDGKIMYVQQYTFHESVVRNVPFFKLPYYGSPILVGDPFKERVEEAGLVGLDFNLVWPPKGGLIHQKNSGSRTENLPKVLPRPAAKRCDVPADAVVVSDDSFKSDATHDIVRSNGTFVNALFDDYFRDDEIAPRALMSYWVDYFLAQLNNGGFGQFVYNSSWNDKIVRAVREGLSAMNSMAYLALFEAGTNLVERIGADGLAAYLDSGYFGENLERDEFDVLTDEFFGRSEREPLTALNGAWIRSLPDLVVLSTDEMRAEIQRRVSLMTDRDERIATALAAEPEFKKRIRALCVAAGQEFSHVTAGDPTHDHGGQRVLAWHFITDRGHHYMVEVDDRTIMYQGESHREITRIHWL